MDKKEIPAKTAVKAIITGFASYGIIITVICMLLLNIGNTFLNNVPQFNSFGLRITLSLIASILIFFIIRLLCKLSTYDVLKKCKINPEDYKKIIKRLNTFFIICIILSMFIALASLYLEFSYQKVDMEYSVLQYNAIFSEDHVNQLEQDMLNQYETSKKNVLASTIIIEVGIALAFLSLISYQRKMITRYNEIEKIENKPQAENNN